MVADGTLNLVLRLPMHVLLACDCSYCIPQRDNLKNPELIASIFYVPFLYSFHLLYI